MSYSPLIDDRKLILPRKKDSTPLCSTSVKKPASNNCPYSKIFNRCKRLPKSLRLRKSVAWATAPLKPNESRTRITQLRRRCCMQPKLSLLDDELIARIIEEACQL